MHVQVPRRGGRSGAPLSGSRLAPSDGIGILGGTFNPPHLGHLTCALRAGSQLGLRRVLLMPVGLPPHKAAGEDPGAEHRLEMCRLAVAGHLQLLVSPLEVERPGPSYTVDTLRAIHAGDPDVELTFIVGGDMATTLPRWREPRAVLELARLAVAERAGAGREEIVRALSPLGAGGRLEFLQMPRIAVSSSQVRERVGRGESIRGLVPGLVADYIAAHRLYLADEELAPAGAAAAAAGATEEAP